VPPGWVDRIDHAPSTPLAVPAHPADRRVHREVRLVAGRSRRGHRAGLVVVRGLGSATASELVSRHKTATEDHPCGRSSVFSGSADQLSVHDVGQAAFQAAHGFVVIFAFGSFPQVVGPAGGIVADLGDGHDVEAEIELAIASAGKPVAHHLAGGHLDGGGAGVTGERGGRLEYRRRYYTGL
jgi:hypothetical protein